MTACVLEKRCCVLCVCVWGGVVHLDEVALRHDSDDIPVAVDVLELILGWNVWAKRRLDPREKLAQVGLLQ